MVDRETQDAIDRAVDGVRDQFLVLLRQVSVSRFDEPVHAPAFVGIGDLLTHGAVRISESSTPDDPASGEGVIYINSSTGDLMAKLNFGGTVKTGTILDWSAL